MHSFVVYLSWAEVQCPDLNELGWSGDFLADLNWPSLSWAEVQMSELSLSGHFWAKLKCAFLSCAEVFLCEQGWTVTFVWAEPVVSAHFSKPSCKAFSSCERSAHFSAGGYVLRGYHPLVFTSDAALLVDSKPTDVAWTRTNNIWPKQLFLIQLWWSNRMKKESFKLLRKTSLSRLGVFV